MTIRSDHWTPPKRDLGTTARSPLSLIATGLSAHKRQWDRYPNLLVMDRRFADELEADPDAAKFLEHTDGELARVVAVAVEITDERIGFDERDVMVLVPGAVFDG